MQKTHSAEPLESLAYFDHGDGTADVYLRRNIATESITTNDGGSATAYCADEVHAVTEKPKAWFEQNFDAGWIEVDRASMTSDDRMADLESQIEEQASAIDELAAIMAGGE